MVPADQIAERVAACPDGGGPPTCPRGHYVGVLVIDEEDRVGPQTGRLLHRSVEQGCRFRTADRGGIVHGVEPIPQAERIPKIAGTLVFLDGGEMDLDPSSPEPVYLVQQAPVEMGIVREPIIYERVIRDGTRQLLPTARATERVRAPRPPNAA